MKKNIYILMRLNPKSACEDSLLKLAFILCRVQTKKLA